MPKNEIHFPTSAMLCSFQLIVFQVLFSPWNEFCEFRSNFAEEKIMPKSDIYFPYLCNAMLISADSFPGAIFTLE